MRTSDKPPSLTAARFAAHEDDENSRPRAPTPYKAMDRQNCLSHHVRNEHNESRKKERPSSRIAAKFPEVVEDDDPYHSPRGIERKPTFHDMGRNSANESRKKERPSSRIAAKFPEFVEDDSPCQSPQGIERESTFHDIGRNSANESRKKERPSSRIAAKFPEVVEDDDPYQSPQGIKRKPTFHDMGRNSANESRKKERPSSRIAAKFPKDEEDDGPYQSPQESRKKPSSRIAAKFPEDVEDDSPRQSPQGIERKPTFHDMGRNSANESRKKERPSSRIAAKFPEDVEDDGPYQSPQGIERKPTFHDMGRNSANESNKQDKPSSRIAARSAAFSSECKGKHHRPRAPTPNHAFYSHHERKERKELRKKEKPSSRIAAKFSEVVEDNDPHQPFQGIARQPTFHDLGRHNANDKDNEEQAQVHPTINQMAPRPEIPPQPPIVNLAPRTRIIHVMPNPSDTQFSPRRQRPPGQADGTEHSPEEKMSVAEMLRAERQGRSGPIIINVAPQPPIFPPRPPIVPRPPVEPKEKARPNQNSVEKLHQTEAMPKRSCVTLETVEEVDEEDEETSPRRTQNSNIAYLQDEVHDPSDRSRKFGMTYLEKAYGRPGFHLPDIKNNDGSSGRNLVKAMPQKPALIDLTDNNGSYKPAIKMPVLINKTGQTVRATQPYPYQSPMRATKPYPNDNYLRATQSCATESYQNQRYMHTTESYLTTGSTRASEESYTSQSSKNSTESSPSNDPWQETDLCEDQRAVETNPRNGHMQKTYKEDSTARYSESYQTQGQSWTYNQMAPRPARKSAVEQLPAVNQRTALTYKTPTCEQTDVSPEPTKPLTSRKIAKNVFFAPNPPRANRAVYQRRQQTQVVDTSAQTNYYLKMPSRTDTVADDQRTFKRETTSGGYEYSHVPKQKISVDKIPDITQPTWTPMTHSARRRKTSVVLPLPRVTKDTSPVSSPRDQGDSFDIIPRARPSLNQFLDDEDDDYNDIAHKNARCSDITIVKDGTMLIGLEDVHISPSELSYAPTPSSLRTAKLHPSPPGSSNTPRSLGDGQNRDDSIWSSSSAEDVDSSSTEQAETIKRELPFIQRLVRYEEERDKETPDIEKKMLYTIRKAEYNAIMEAERRQFNGQLLDQDKMPHKPKPPHRLNTYVTGPVNVKIATGTHIKVQTADAGKTKRQPPASLRKRRQPKYKEEV